MYYIVYDDFLPPHEFGSLKSYLGPNGLFPWNFSGRINDNDGNNNDMYFGSVVYGANRPPEEQWNRAVKLQPFLDLLGKINIFSLFRVKANLYFPSKTEQVTHHASHIDAEFKHNGALFFLTNCNAPTTMADGVGIESKENRLLLFDASTPHSSSSPSDALYRSTININYFGVGIANWYMEHIINPHPTFSKNPELLGKQYEI